MKCPDGRGSDEQQDDDEKKAAKKALRERARVELAKDTATAPESKQEDSDMMAMMGFAGFGTTKK